MVDNRRNELMRSMHQLFIDSTYSDLVVTCGTDEYHVHRNIVCPRSDFFTVTCGQDWKEAQTNKISLQDDDPQSVKLMLHYLYHLDYPHVSVDDTELDTNEDSTGLNNEESQEDDNPQSIDTWPVNGTDQQGFNYAASGSVETTEGGWGGWGGWGPSGIKDRKAAKRAKKLQAVTQCPNLIIHVRMYALAEKFRIEGLKALALEKFTTESEIHWRSNEFCQAVEEVYTSTIESDRGMRNAVVTTLFRHAQLMDQPDFQKVVRRLYLPYDMLLFLRKNRSRGGWENGFMY